MDVTAFWCSVGLLVVPGWLTASDGCLLELDIDLLWRTIYKRRVQAF